MTHHDEWAAYLDPDEDDPFLPGSVQDGLDRIGDALADEALWDEPPTSLRDRILAEAIAEASYSGIGSVADPLTTVVGREPGGAAIIDPGAYRSDDLTPAIIKARSRWLGMALAAVASAAVAMIAVVAMPRILDDSSGITTYEAAGTELAPDASASVDIETLGAGVAITLNVTDLPPAGEGEYYAGWVVGPDGMVPVGSFHFREPANPIELWSGVDVARYPNLMVTLQQEGEPPIPSGVIVMNGSLLEP